MPLLKEFISIPERVNRGDFVLNLADGVQRPEETLRHYVVTKQLRASFEEALSFIKGALDSRASKATYLHGSFGAGKSHFMAVLHLLLQHHPTARENAELASVCLQHTWVEGKKFLLIPFHMIGAVSMESAILGGYERHVRELHPQAPPPAVYQTESLFRDARRLLETLGAEKFFATLNSASSAEDMDWGSLSAERWNAATFEEALQAPPRSESRRQLVQDLIHTFFQSYADVARDQSEAFVALDEGLAAISQHAASLKYDGLILFLDELVLWLASRAADLRFVHQEGQKLVKLVEAQRADRPVPIISFVARQRDLRELVGEQLSGQEEFNFSEALKHWEGRFHTINLEDRNLPEIASRRLLQPLDEPARKRVDEAFQSLRLRDDAREVLLTSRYDLETFRKVYPFSPTLVETLVAVSSVLQRERTALRIMVELLVEQRDRLELGQVIPVGDLYDHVARGEEAYNRSLKDAFESARRLHKGKFLPLLADQHGVDPENPPEAGKDPDLDRRWQAFRNDERLVKTLLLSALVPEVEAFQGLTPSKLAALNHGTIRSPIQGREAQTVLTKLSQWAPQIGELRLGEEGANPSVRLQLTSVDIERVLEQVNHLDNAGNRKRKVRELLFHAMGLKDPDSAELSQVYPVFWRGTTRRFEVAYLNVRETRPENLAPTSDLPRLILDFPFDEQGYYPKDDLLHLQDYLKSHPPVRTLVWLPSFLSPSLQKDLGRLCKLDYVLTEQQFEDSTRHLAATDRPIAHNLLENQRNALRVRLRNALEMAYGIRTAEPGVLDPDNSLTTEEQFHSLDPAFRPRPPVGADLAEALRALLTQELAFRYPGHPEFPVDTELRATHARPVLKELLRAVQEPDGRLIVADKPMRDKLQQIAEPLRLGSMHDNVLLLKDDWRRQFEQRIFQEGEPARLSVKDFYRWMEEPRATGLPDLLKNLVIVVFAAQTNRVFQRGGLTVASPEVDQLTPDMELVEQSLPPESEWQEACRRARLLFKLDAPIMRNADNVLALVQMLQEKVRPWETAAQSLPGELSGLLEALSLDPETSPRLKIQRQARELVAGLQNREPLVVIQRFAQVSLPDAPEALTRALENGPAQLDSFSRVSEGIVRELAGLEEEHPQARALLDPLKKALLHSEHAMPLRSPLETMSRDGARTLVEITRPVSPSPEPKPDPKPGLTKLFEKSFKKLAPSVVEEKLAKLQQYLEDEHNRIDLSFTVWRETP